MCVHLILIPPVKLTQTHTHTVLNFTAFSTFHGIKILSLWFVCRYYPKSAALKLQFVYFRPSPHTVFFSICLTLGVSMCFRTLWQTCKHTHIHWFYHCVYTVHCTVYTFLWHLCMKSNQRTTSLCIGYLLSGKHVSKNPHWLIMVYENIFLRSKWSEIVICVWDFSRQLYCNKIVLSDEQSDVFGNLSLDFVVVAAFGGVNWVALL